MMMSQYKVFLCHNSNDKPEVRQIRDQLLLQQGIETWMDEKNLSGFDDWKEKIKENLSQINAVAVFLGSSGFGEWQKYEIIYTEQEINRRKQNKLLPLRAGLVILKSCEQTFPEIRDNYYHTPYGWLFNYQTVDLRASKAPMKELIGAITGQPWQVDGSSREVIETQNIPQNRRNDSDDDLSSETDVNYTALQFLLKTGQWRKANDETVAVMFKATGRKKWLRFSGECIENFPCTDLRTIDQLWVKYSGRGFGFSVQKRIWESEIVGKDIGKFGDHVGWRKGAFWNWLDYNQLTFSIDAPMGHLPALFFLEGGAAIANFGSFYGSMTGFVPSPIPTLEEIARMRERTDITAYLFSRVQTCKL